LIPDQQMMQSVLKYSRKSLSSAAISYLKSRGITKQVALDWEIGFIPSNEFFDNLQGDREALYHTGLLIRKMNLSPLKGYITFPLYNQYDQLIGFSGRPPISNEQVKLQNMKKYWHTIIDKRNFLFGFNKAKVPALEQGYIIIAEGQFDTITAHQFGIQNIVSTCGTALTENQIILISRYTDKAYVVFDNDEAGRRAFSQLQKHNIEGIKLIPVILPDSSDGAKEDPDSFIRKYGKDKFLECLLGGDSNGAQDNL
jgi:DNA primase